MLDKLKKAFDKGYNGNPLLKKARKKIEWKAELVDEWLKFADDPI